MSAKIIASRVTAAEYARQCHRVTPEAGSKLSDMLVPSYWAHVAAKLHEGDFVEILPEDKAWYAQGIVMSCSQVHARIEVLVSKVLAEEAKPEVAAKDEPFEITFKGPSRKWSILRVEDKAVVKEQFDSKKDANAWLEANRTELVGKIAA